ncbi:unnamed protein product (macronuclear) [Paramecium tetraurelia]|uniref:RING-type domain-containing protein n=1 Tax=Paramecium tetraurelia TaxID=5888 RepID=A0CF71_PARTE|nr:uncharacterized protein GSPATT00037877001 [Paramecium tetraurelia]CAK69438.1 unnamed protein product [Paramecium tetraurelia]|eukprot:XP_001436835.1 hypothetical protein (macronuclear) [Paramecium tetraurelia strain d4-2]
MNIVILCKSILEVKIVDPNQKIYDYMCKIFERPKNNIIVQISPTEKIDQEEYFSKFMNENLDKIAFYVLDSNGCSIQYTNQPYKKQTSITQYGYCSQETDEISLSRTLTRNISSQNFDIGTVKVIQTNVCTFCTTQIEEDDIQTSCQHFYHAKCFKLIIENQLLQKSPVLNCMCKIQLNLSSLFRLDDKFILNQLSALEKNIQKKFGNEFRKCKNVKSCKFFYLHLPFIQDQHEYCPECLWRINK